MKPKRFVNMLVRTEYEEKRRIYLEAKTFHEEEVRMAKYEEQQQGSVGFALLKACGGEHTDRESAKGGAIALLRGDHEERGDE